MAEERNNPLPQENEQEQPETASNDERFLSDTQKIVRRHLENEDDVISDEDIRNVRVGMSPPILDPATEARFGDEEEKEEVEKEYLGDLDEDSKAEADEKRKITPWDTLNPE